MRRVGEEQRRWQTVGGNWAWAGIATVVCAAMSPLEPSLLEEGLIVHFADRMAGGEHLYRDLVFLSGPFPFELLALVFRVFGADVNIGRAVIALLSGTSAGLAFALARHARCGAMAHLAAACFAFAPVLLFPLLSTYFYTTLAMHLSVLAVYAAFRGMDSARWAVAAGVAIASVALTKQTIGVAIALGAVACVFSQTPRDRRSRQCLWLFAGGAASTVMTLIVYGARGDLGALVQAMVVMPLALGESFSSGYVNLWPIGEFVGEIQRNRLFYIPHLYNILTGQHDEIGASIIALTQLLFALPILALLLPLARRAWGGTLPPALWFQQALVFALFTNLFPRADWGHVVFVLPVAAAQLVSTLGVRRAAAKAAPQSVGAPIVVATLCVLFAVGSFGAGRQLYEMAGPASFGPRIPQRPVSPSYRDPGVPRVIHFLLNRTHPGDPIFVARAEPLIYFATQTQNPTPYGGLTLGLGDLQQRTIIDALAEVEFVVMSEIDQPFFLYYRDELPAVQAHLERFFHVPAVFERYPSWILALERGADRGPVAIDLFERRHEALAWTLDSSGEVQHSAAATPLPEMATRRNRRPLPVLLGQRGGGLDFSVDLPANAVFRSDLGLAWVSGPNGTRQHARGLQMAVQIRNSSDTSNPKTFRRVHSQAVRLNRASAGRWTPFEVDLSAFAGQSVTLRLESVAREPLGPDAIAWWGSPAIVTRPVAEDAGSD